METKTMYKKVGQIIRQYEPEFYETGSAEWIGLLLFSILLELGRGTNHKRLCDLRETVTFLSCLRGWKLGVEKFPQNDQSEIGEALMGCWRLLKCRTWAPPKELHQLHFDLVAVWSTWDIFHDH